MKVQTYTDDTRKKIVDFLKNKRQALISEISCLGGKSAVINWESLVLILEDLTDEGFVRQHFIGKKVVVYEWIK